MNNVKSYKHIASTMEGQNNECLYPGDSNEQLSSFIDNVLGTCD